MGFLQITSDGSVLFDDRDRDGLALGNPGALGPDEFPGFHTMPVRGTECAVQRDRDAEILARFRDTPHNPWSDGSTGITARSGLEIVCEDEVIRKCCTSCGEVLVIARLDSGKRVPLSPARLEARWLLVQRHDGRFVSCPSWGAGYSLHRCTVSPTERMSDD